MSVLERLPNAQEVTANMQRLAALGLELHVDHFEISVPMPPTEQNLQRQAAAYSSYLSTCLSVATCKAFLTWGFTDRNAWAPNRWPGKGLGAAMPFDTDYKPKPAYQAMLELSRSGRRMRGSEFPKENIRDVLRPELIQPHVCVSETGHKGNRGAWTKSLRC
jgi:GH35 family endo-1,4-beta-xylanase